MTKKRWRNPDKRMAHAVKLRSEGWSLRQIGAELNVDESTVRKDLRRAEQTATQDAVVLPLRKRCGIDLRDTARNPAESRTTIPQEGSAS